MAAPASIVFKDKDAAQDKEKVMRLGRMNSLFFAMKDTFSFLAGVMMPLGMATLLPEIMKGLGGKLVSVAGQGGANTILDLTTTAGQEAAAAVAATTGVEVAAASTGIMGAVGLAAGTTMGAVGVAVLGVAVALTAVAITSHYISSRYFQNANFDALEVNAKHTARYLSQEIQKDNKCLTEKKAVTYDNPGRTDGKSWVQAASRPQSQQHVR